MLAVTESGSGTPLVLLHGWGLHSGVWQSSLPALEKKFHCHAVDMLGHGDSALKQNQIFNLANMNEALHLLIQKIDSDKIVLLGWSLGGLVAMDYVSKYPKDINKLILVTTNASFCKKNDWLHAMDESVLDGFAQQLEQDYKKTVGKFMALQMLGADDYKQSLKMLKKFMTSRSMPEIETLRQGLHILKTIDLRSKLKSIAQPVLMISAEYDRLMPYQAADAMQLLFNNATNKVIKGAGHAPFISHLEEFVQAINKFTKE